MPLENTHRYVPASHDNREVPAENDGNKTEVGLEMPAFRLDAHSPFPDGLDRVFPIRSVLEIEPQHSDNQSSSSHDRGTRRGSEGVASTSLSEEPTYGWGAPGWKTKVAQTTDDPGTPYTTTRFSHRITKDGHMVVIGSAGAEKLHRCEDEPIHTPGAVQGFGALVVLHELVDKSLKVRIASENSRDIIGYSPAHLFVLNDFCELLSEEQTEEFYENVEFVRGDTKRDPEVFSLHIIAPDATVIKLWCALSVHRTNKDMILCEFELEEDVKFPTMSSVDTPCAPADTLGSNPTAEEISASTEVVSRPLRILRRAKQTRGEIAALNVYRMTSQIQEQFGAAVSMDHLLKVIVGVVKEVTRFHRVLIYQFDSSWNGKVVAELVDMTKTKDLYMGLYFPAYDIPEQARNLYKINKVRLLYDREMPTARLVCKSATDLETPLDMTYCYLRAMSPIHLKYLENMGVRASMSISITINGNLWGLISCHSYGNHGMRVTFPLRKMCMIIGESASRNVERLTDTSKLQARKLIHTVPIEQVPSGYIVASSDDLLKLFQAEFGILSINNETKLLGKMIATQEALALLEYLRIKRFKSVTTCQHIAGDFPDLKYPPGFQILGGFLHVPLSSEGSDFIVFLRKWQLKQIHWAGNPFVDKQEIAGSLMPRKSFNLWVENVKGKCSEWTEDQVETAAVLCLVYGKFIEAWRQKEAVLQTSQMTKLLLANASHELRTPLNAIINFMEIALEGPLDKETRDNLSRSHVASKSLIYAINDLLDLTRTEQGQELIKEEDFNLVQTARDTIRAFHDDIERKGLMIDLIVSPDFPVVVRGDETRMRQCIINLLSNAVKYTDQGGIAVELNVVNIRDTGKVNVEITVQDTGVGMNAEEMDILFRQLEQVQNEDELSLTIHNDSGGEGFVLTKSSAKKVLGLGIAKVGRIIQTIGGQLRVTSEKSKGSRFTMQLTFSLPINSSTETYTLPPASSKGMPEKSQEVTILDYQSKQSLRMGRRASGENLFGARYTDTNRPVNAMQNVVNARTPTTGSSDALPTLGKVGTSMTKLTPQKVKRVSPPQPSGELGTRKEEENTGTPKISMAGPPPTPLPPIKVPVTSGDDKGAVIQQPPPLSHSLPEKGSGKRLTILVAEDDPINRLIIKKRMERMGYTVKLTVNGQQCVDVFKNGIEKYDLILMDMQMPIMDGGSATALIRKIEATSRNSFSQGEPAGSIPKCKRSRVPIFVISASLVEGKRLEYIEMGFDGWIMKPVDFKRLEVLIKGITDIEVRKCETYTPGKWGIGGWFFCEPREGKADVSIGRRLSITPGGWPVATLDGNNSREDQKNASMGGAKIGT